MNKGQSLCLIHGVARKRARTDLMKCASGTLNDGKSIGDQHRRDARHRAVQQRQESVRSY